MNKLNLVPWKTIISLANGLFFESLHDNGVLRVIYKDRENNQYEIVCNRPYSYRMSEEDLLLDYWSLKPKGSGWTSIVSGAHWGNISYLLMEESNVKHYLVGSYDLCLELLSDIPPNIRKISRPKML